MAWFNPSANTLRLCFQPSKAQTLGSFTDPLEHPNPPSSLHYQNTSVTTAGTHTQAPSNAAELTTRARRKSRGQPVSGIQPWGSTALLPAQPPISTQLCADLLLYLISCTYTLIQDKFIQSVSAWDKFICTIYKIKWQPSASRLIR